MIQPNDCIEILSRPCGTSRNPPSDAFAKKMLAGKDVAELMEDDSEPQQVFDKMPLCLHDALFPKQFER